MNLPNNQSSASGRRRFLAGAVTGALALQTGHWIARKVAPVPVVESKLPPFQKITYSQSNEDLIVQSIFDHFKIRTPSYIDIGASDPINMNNTYLFYLQGSRGVLVEPNTDLIPSLTEVRPGDTILNAGIGLSDDSAVDYYRLSDPTWNTFSKEQVDQVIARTRGKETEVKLLETVKMPMLAINGVFDRYFKGTAPDFVSIDIEGLDLPILRTINFVRFRPKVICVETLITATNDENTETGKFLISKGYVPRGASFINTIFVDKALIENKE